MILENSTIRFADRVSPRVLTVCMISACILGVILSFSQIVFDAQSESREIDDTTNQVLTMMRQPAVEAAYNIDENLAARVVDGLIKFNAIYDARILLSPTEILAERTDAKLVSRWRSISDAIFESQREYIIKLKVSHLDEAVGELKIMVDTYHAGSHFLERSALIIFSGIIRAVILASVLGAIFYFMITRPLSRMVESVASVDLDALEKTRLPPYPSKRYNEFSLWVDAANELFGSIEENLNRRKEAEDQAKYLSSHDRLTGLPNRQVFMNVAHQSLQKAEGQYHRVGVLLCDIRDFQTINERHGEHIGDRLLHAFGRRLRKTVPSGDVVARLGSDQFAILLARVEQNDAPERLAEEIVSTTSKPFDVDGHGIALSVCVGVTTYPDDADGLDGLLHNADRALNLAKSGGSNRYQVFRSRLDVATRKDLLQELEVALEQDRLELFFQPQLSVEADRPVGGEALLRWKHPQKGYIPPEVFLQLAEDNGLMGKLTLWTITNACREAQAWSHMIDKPVRVSVNLSGSQLLESDLLSIVAENLMGSQLPADLLELEIPETALVSNLERNQEVLEKLHAHGVGIVVDKFGSGRSSVSDLKQLPIDRVKIDMSLVRDLLVDGGSAELVSAMISLGHSLGLKVLAEGVEEKAQLELLASYELDEYQGYYYAAPVAASRFQRLLREEASG